MIRKVEPYLFFILTIVHASLVYLINGFSTIDGPAHSYNAFLIYQLLFEDAPLISTFYEFNSFWTPNVTGHYLMVVFQLFLEPVQAEKLFVFLLTIGLIYAQRNYLKSLSKDFAFYSYFAFPLTFSLTYFFGFYNYSIALIAYILMLTLLIRSSGVVATRKQKLQIFILLACIYFSHALVFAFSAFSLILFALFRLFQKKIEVQKAIKELIIFSLLLLPFMVLFLFYLSPMSSGMGESTYVSTTDSMKALFDLNSLVAFDGSKESSYTRVISISILFLLVLAIIKRVKNNIELDQSKLGPIVLLIGSFVIFYFSFPDYTLNGGIILIRIQWFLLLFLIAAVSLFKTDLIPKLMVGLALIFSHFSLMTYYLETQESRGIEWTRYLEISKRIEANSVLLPLSRSSWTTTHFCNLLALKSNTISLYNYENLQNYFPLRLKGQELPSLRLGDRSISKDEIDFLPESHTEELIQINYVFVHIADQNYSSNPDLKETLDQFYELEIEMDGLQLFKLKMN